MELMVKLSKDSEKALLDYCEIEFQVGINKDATFSGIEQDVFKAFYKEYKRAREELDELH